MVTNKNTFANEMNQNEMILENINC